MIRADAIDLPIALRVPPHLFCIVEPRWHDSAEVVHREAVKATDLVQTVQDIGPHELRSHSIIRSLKVPVGRSGDHALAYCEVSLTIDWLPKDHVGLHHQHVVTLGWERSLEEPVVQGPRLVVRRVVVSDEVVLGTAVIRMDVRWADVQTWVPEWVITRH